MIHWTLLHTIHTYSYHEQVDYTRRSLVAKNHTATHILNYALRQVLGEKVDQKGSLVTEDKLRFDFSHGKPVEVKELRKIEEICNDMIHKSCVVHFRDVALDTAKAITGLRVSACLSMSQLSQCWDFQIFPRGYSMLQYFAVEVIGFSWKPWKAWSQWRPMVILKRWNPSPRVSCLSFRPLSSHVLQTTDQQQSNTNTCHTTWPGAVDVTWCDSQRFAPAIFSSVYCWIAGKSKEQYLVKLIRILSVWWVLARRLMISWPTRPHHGECRPV